MLVSRSSPPRAWVEQKGKGSICFLSAYLSWGIVFSCPWDLEGSLMLGPPKSDWNYTTGKFLSKLKNLEAILELRNE